MMSDNAIPKRFVVSFLANVAKGCITFLTSMLLARWLGPEDFGRMAYLLASFIAFKHLIDFASSSAFFTFLSQKSRSRYFIRLFWLLVASQFLVSFVLVAFIVPSEILKSLWMGESRGLIVLAMIATFMQHHVWNIASQMAEASRATIIVQRLNVLVVAFHLIVVCILASLGSLFLPLIFIALIFEFAVASLFASKMYSALVSVNRETGDDNPISIFKKFAKYCFPFIPYSFLSCMHEFLDRWMLQKWSGASEQAYYAVAQQCAGVSLLVTSSILRIFWKEIAEAQFNGDIQRIRDLYFIVCRRLYAVAAFVACGLIPWADELVLWFLGNSYVAGSTTVLIMLVYPIHQSISQISSIVLYATERTKIQVVIGICFMISSMIAAYLILAPTTFVIPGFGFGSGGLAFKMVLLQLIQANITVFVLSKIFGWRYDCVYQIIVFITLLLVGWAAKIFALTITSGSLILPLLLGGAVYVILASLLAFLAPSLIACRRDDISNLLARFINYLTPTSFR